MRVERLASEHAAAYRALMLEAYAEGSGEFTSTVAEREPLPLAWWRARLGGEEDEPDRVVGAFDEGSLVGAAGLRFERRERTRHRAALYGLFVRPPYRGRGIARALVEAVLAEARAAGGANVVQLTVTETNAAAIRLYEQCGFRSWGVDPFAIRIGDRLLGKRHMWRRIGDDEA